MGGCPRTGWETGRRVSFDESSGGRWGLKVRGQPVDLDHTLPLKNSPVVVKDGQGARRASINQTNIVGSRDLKPLRKMGEGIQDLAGYPFSITLVDTQRDGGP
jgi:hypothetical protein